MIAGKKKHNEPHIVGIGGPSRSGKSTLAKNLAEHLGRADTLILDMDDYVRPKNELPTINGLPNWEIPDAVDYERIIQTIEKNKTHYRFIIIEGILAFADEHLKNYYNTSVFMKIPRETFYERRKEEKRWGTEPAWYWDHVWEAHLKHGQYPEADFVFSGETDFKNAELKQLIKKITDPNR